MNELVLYGSAFGGSYEKYMTQVSTQTVTAIAADKINEHIDKASLQIQRGLILNTKAVLANTHATAQLGRTMIASTELLNSTMEFGFGSISNELGSMKASISIGLDGISSAIEKISDKICSKLDEIHDIVNNPLLTASRELYSRAVTNYQKQFFEESLEDILAAIEKNKTDYISWFLAGQLYLFGISEFSNVINVSKAEEAFMNVTKYISPDVGNSEEATKLASEAYYYLAYSRYILSNENKLENNNDESKKYLETAIQAGTKSYSLSEKMYEALYNTARCNVLLENKDNALKLIEKCIKADSYYILKFLGDDDFKSIYDNIIELVEKLRQELIVSTKENLEIIKDIPLEYGFREGKFSTLVQNKISELSEFEIPDDIEYLDLRKKTEDINVFIDFFKKEDFPVERLAYKQELCAEFLPKYGKHFCKTSYKNSMVIKKDPTFPTLFRNYHTQHHGLNVCEIDDGEPEAYRTWGYRDSNNKLIAVLLDEGCSLSETFDTYNRGEELEKEGKEFIEFENRTLTPYTYLEIKDRTFYSKEGFYKIAPKVEYKDAVDYYGKQFNEISKVCGLSITDTLFKNEVLILENEIKKLDEIFPVFTNEKTLMVYRFNGTSGENHKATVFVFKPSIFKLAIKKKRITYEDDLVLAKLFHEYVTKFVEYYTNDDLSSTSENNIQKLGLERYKRFIEEEYGKYVFSDRIKHVFTEQEIEIINNHTLLEDSCIYYNSLISYLQEKYKSDNEILKILNDTKKIRAIGEKEAKAKWAAKEIEEKKLKEIEEERAKEIENIKRQKRNKKIKIGSIIGAVVILAGIMISMFVL